MRIYFARNFTCFKPRLVRRSSSSAQNKILTLLQTMPKDPKTEQLRDQRLNKQELSARWRLQIPSIINLQVLGNGTKGSPRCLHLFTGNRRYLFNCGEGTQRFAHEHKIRLAKLEHIFITHKSWDNLGGLPGLTLTVQDIGVPSFTLHGPSRVEDLFDMTRGFIMRKYIRIEKHEFHDPPYEDCTMRVECVALYGPKRCVGIDHPVNTAAEEEPVEYYDNEELVLRNNARKRAAINLPSSQPGFKKPRLGIHDSDEKDVSVAYICKFHGKPGQLKKDLCVKFGVPVGPLLGQLKNGEDVTLANGTVVHSKDVVGPGDPDIIMIVVECPTVDYLDALLDAKAFESYQATAKSEADFCYMVVHFTPSAVMQHPKYCEWMQRFSLSTLHFLVNDSCSGCPTTAIPRIQYKLNLLHPDVFPLLRNEHECLEKPKEFDYGVNVVHSEPLMLFYLRPSNKGIDQSWLLKVNSEEYIKEAMDSEGFPKALDNLRLKIEELQKGVPPVSGLQYPEIVFLGTGSSIPSKARNVSSILVHLSPDKTMLLDCGEGTYIQILRLYGKTETDKILKKLTAVFISHLHADHQMGLVSILLERRKLFSPTDSLPPLYLVSPRQINYWLRLFHNDIEPILDEFKFVGNGSLQSLGHSLPDDEYQQVVSDIGLKDLATEMVLHCKHAFGIIISHNDGWKIVYSGDTMPCDALAIAGKGCDLLIHEATMEDDLVEEARLKTHSTTSEAIEIGRKMEAKFTILTHFSQRYAKVPLFTDDFNHCVGVAFDNMKVTLGTLRFLPHFIPSLKLMFSEDYEEMQEKTGKKLQRQVKTPSLEDVKADSTETKQEVVPTR